MGQRRSESVGRDAGTVRVESIRPTRRGRLPRGEGRLRCIPISLGTMRICSTVSALGARHSAPVTRPCAADSATAGSGRSSAALHRRVRRSVPGPPPRRESGSKLRRRATRDRTPHRGDKDGGPRQGGPGQARRAEPGELANVRSWLEADLARWGAECPLMATSGHPTRAC